MRQKRLAVCSAMGCSHMLHSVSPQFHILRLVPQITMIDESIVMIGQWHATEGIPLVWDLRAAEPKLRD